MATSENAGGVRDLLEDRIGYELKRALTEEGEKVRAECARRVDAVEERMASHLYGDERRALLKALRCLSGGKPRG